ncbi:MAG: flagellum-specific ATP synthase FliI [Desulfobacteraceae bacterium 4572_19]|nr:MAG: flagellum-specific ATP synthase FliI [Desulfobacteraceae bacterium 4572_19]
MDWNPYIDAVNDCKCTVVQGKIVKVVGLVAEAFGLGMSIGSLCSIKNEHGLDVMAEVVGFKDDRALLMPYGDTRGLRPGSQITLLESSPTVMIGENFLGRVMDGMGEPIDGRGPIKGTDIYPLYGKAINPLERRPIKELMDVGIAAVNTIIPLGRGQRIAIMAGSGVGKSVLMGMMTKHTAADVTVIGLVGERGREVKDFVADTLGEEGLKHAVVVAATSDSPPLVRMRGAYLATTIAEYFRDQGKNVLLMVDSITRFAMSSRDVGLAAGEPPTTRGYTPSFFVQIPILLERAGTVSGKGSITGIYTVLVEGDDMNDPVGDTVRSIVDGHIVLSRKLANRGHYPAIEVLESVSRVMHDVCSPENMEYRNRAVDLLSTWKDSEDMIMMGAYVSGSDPKIDEARKLVPEIINLLRQQVGKRVTYNESIQKLKEILGPGR